jgi:hypothetical protein
VRRLSSNLLPLRGVATLDSWTEWVSAGAKITHGIPSGNCQSQTNAALFMCLCWPVYWNITLTHLSSLSYLLVCFSSCQDVHCFCCEALPLCTLERSGCRQKHILQEPPFGGRLPVSNQCMLLSWARNWPVYWNIHNILHIQRTALVFRYHCCTFVNLKVPIGTWSNFGSSTQLAWLE